MGFDATLLARLRTGHLIGDGEASVRPLSGGVASDIWHVSAGGRDVVVKMALEKLRVAADWRVPVSRNAAEVVWLKRAGQAVPGAAPSVLAHWPDLGAFVMEWLPYPVWKTDLLAGRVDAGFSASAGRALAEIHAATAGDSDVAAGVNDDGLFRAIRLDPYFGPPAGLYPEAAGTLEGLVMRTLVTKQTLVHGDVSPKNILCGPEGPVFLDAECAWYGDPAFDLGFVLNHLLLKTLVVPARSDLLEAFAALSEAYLDGCTWDERGAVEKRVASLLPALLLARIDGKSPVEYITDAAVKDAVRAFALPRLLSPPASLSGLAGEWRSEMLTKQETA